MKLNVALFALPLAIAGVYPLIQGLQAVHADDAKDAGELQKEALRLRDKDGLPREALAKFKAAWSKLETARIALEIGRTHLLLHECLEAEDFLGKALTVAPPSDAKLRKSHDGRRDEAIAMLPLATKCIATVQIRWETGTTPVDVAIGDKKVSTGVRDGGASLRLNPGNYKFWYDPAIACVGETCPPKAEPRGVVVTLSEGDSQVITLKGAAVVSAKPAKPPELEEKAKPAGPGELALHFVIHCGAEELPLDSKELEISLDGAKADSMTDEEADARGPSAVNAVFSAMAKGGKGLLRLASPGCIAEERYIILPNTSAGGRVTYNYEGRLEPSSFLRKPMISTGWRVSGMFSYSSENLGCNSCFLYSSLSTSPPTPTLGLRPISLAMGGIAVEAASESEYLIFGIRLGASWGSGALRESIDKYGTVAPLGTPRIISVGMYSIGGLVGLHIPFSFATISVGGYGEVFYRSHPDLEGFDENNTFAGLGVGGFIGFRLQPFDDISLELQYTPVISFEPASGVPSHRLFLAVNYHLSKPERNFSIKREKGVTSTVPGSIKEPGWPPPDASTCEVSKKDTEDAKTLYTLGISAYNISNYTGAIKYWKDAYKRDCSAHLVLKNLGKAYEADSQYAAALEVYRLFRVRAKVAGDELELIDRKIANLSKKIGGASDAAPRKDGDLKPEPRTEGTPDVPEASPGSLDDRR